MKQKITIALILLCSCIIVTNGSPQRSSTGIGFLIFLSGGRWGVIQAPLGLQRLVNGLGSRELEIARLLGNDGTLMLWLELGDKLGLEAASLLRVQVTLFLWHINERCDCLIMTLLRCFLCDTSCPTYPNW